MNLLDNLSYRTIKFIKKLFGWYESSLSHKRFLSKEVFEKYIAPTGVENNVSKIFYLGSYRADGKYLTRIKKILDSGEYYKICWLNKGRSYYVEDDPYGDHVEIFLIQYINNKSRIIAALTEVPEWQKIYTGPYKFSTMFDLDNIPQSSLSFIYCKEQVYPN